MQPVVFHEADDNFMFGTLVLNVHVVHYPFSYHNEPSMMHVLLIVNHRIVTLLTSHSVYVVYTYSFCWCSRG